MKSPVLRRNPLWPRPSPHLGETMMPPQSSPKRSFRLLHTLSRGNLLSARTSMAWFRFPIVMAVLLMLAPVVRAADAGAGASDPAVGQIESFYAVLLDTM